MYTAANYSEALDIIQARWSNEVQINFFDEKHARAWLKKNAPVRVKCVMKKPEYNPLSAPCVHFVKK